VKPDIPDATGELHPEELKDTGLCPRDFELVAGVALPSVPFHPDDQYREHEMERHDEKSESSGIEAFLKDS
jgi:hypothetical protein